MMELMGSGHHIDRTKPIQNPTYVHSSVSDQGVAEQQPTYFKIGEGRSFNRSALKRNLDLSAADGSTSHYNQNSQTSYPYESLSQASKETLGATPSGVGVGVLEPINEFPLMEEHSAYSHSHGGGGSRLGGKNYMSYSRPAKRIKNSMETVEPAFASLSLGLLSHHGAQPLQETPSSTTDPSRKPIDSFKTATEPCPSGLTVPQNHLSMLPAFLEQQSDTSVPPLASGARSPSPQLLKVHSLQQHNSFPGSSRVAPAVHSRRLGQNSSHTSNNLKRDLDKPVTEVMQHFDDKHKRSYVNEKVKRKKSKSSYDISPNVIYVASLDDSEESSADDMGEDEDDLDEDEDEKSKNRVGLESSTKRRGKRNISSLGSKREREAVIHPPVKKEDSMVDDEALPVQVQGDDSSHRPELSLNSRIAETLCKDPTSLGSPLIPPSLLANIHPPSNQHGDSMGLILYKPLTLPVPAASSAQEIKGKQAGVSLPQNDDDLSEDDEVQEALNRHKTKAKYLEERQRQRESSEELLNKRKRTDWEEYIRLAELEERAHDHHVSSAGSRSHTASSGHQVPTMDVERSSKGESTVQMGRAGIQDRETDDQMDID